MKTTIDAMKQKDHTQDLAMMVRRLVISIRRLAEDDSKDLVFANACLQWVKEMGLAGSPLRDDTLSREEAQTVEP